VLCVLVAGCEMRLDSEISSATVALTLALTLALTCLHCVHMLIRNESLGHAAPWSSVFTTFLHTLSVSASSR
jgi:hypothetical protein